MDGRILTPVLHLAKDRIREQEADAVGPLPVERLVREGGEHGSEALLGALAELAVREDVEVVAPDACEDALPDLDRIHPERRVGTALELPLQLGVAGVGVARGAHAAALADVGL